MLDGRPLPQVDLATGVAEYLDAIKHRGLSANTIAAYALDLRHACAFFATLDVVLVALLSERAVDQWITALGREGVSKRTAARRLAGLRGFVRYAQRQGWLRHDPTEGVAVKFAARRITAPELDELLRMIDAIPAGPGASVLDRRDAALLRLTLDSALRIHEVAGLDVAGENSVDMRRLEVHTLGKGGKHGCVAINARTARMLREWLVVRPLLAKPDESALFVSERGRRLERQTVHAMVRRRGLAAGIDGLHLHLLRHRRIGNVVETLGLHHGQALARHASAATTAAVYGAHADSVSRRILRERADLDEGRAA